MEWYEELDFDEDPFSADPRENHEKLVNVQELLEEIFYRIDSGSMLVVEGPEGSGKTTSLMMAARKFGGKKNVAYVDCKVLDTKLNITRVLQDRYGVFGRLFNKKPKNMIVLMDNVDYLTRQNTERLKYYFDQNYIKSIIFTTKSFRRAKFSDSLRDRIGKRVVKIPEFEEEDAIEMIRNRIGETELFNDELIKKIFKLSKGSPKTILKNCAKVTREAVSKGRNRVQMIDLKILSEQ
ncbi:ATP-binding protein [Candidatus Woesearchaeota archaeon]|nr:ATP-binding protein [Candidatus Woesearchaeota archaeon]